MEKLSTKQALTQALRKTDVTSSFIPPDAGDVCWQTGSETFTREEVAYLLWTQIAMISNDLKTHCGKDLTEDMFEILKFPRIPQF
jgi:hypothetical protein